MHEETRVTVVKCPKCSKYYNAYYWDECPYCTEKNLINPLKETV